MIRPMIKLNKEQTKHMKTMRWLLSTGNRGQGRTFLTCLVLVQYALENPGSWIAIFDHHGNDFRTLNYSLRQVATIFDAHPNHIKELYNLEISRKNCSFRTIKK